MTRRQRYILKLLSVLLFSIELLSPLAHHAGNLTPCYGKSETSLFASSGSFDFFALFLLEENSNEKEGEEDENKRVFCFIDFTFVEVFNALQKFKVFHFTWSSPMDQLNSQPSLLTLHSILII